MEICLRPFAGRWRGVGPCAGRRVQGEEALRLACGDCGVELLDGAAPLAGEFREMFLEWYFSGNWIKEEEDEAV